MNSLPLVSSTQAPQVASTSWAGDSRCDQGSATSGEFSQNLAYCANNFDIPDDFNFEFYGQSYDGVDPDNRIQVLTTVSYTSSTMETQLKEELRQTAVMAVHVSTTMAVSQAISGQHVVEATTYSETVTKPLVPVYFTPWHHTSLEKLSISVAQMTL